MKRHFTAIVRDHRTGDITTATGTTDVPDDKQAKAAIQDEVRKLPGRKTATDIDLY
ncbi:hypothetical protein [Streptomyces sp. LN245]|uniref:hypothetical protein n=1 Tax=Streptomyces sp. LN245 TaxID=3112975 RepID=UPI00372323B6